MFEVHLPKLKPIVVALTGIDLLDDIVSCTS